MPENSDFKDILVQQQTAQKQKGPRNWEGTLMEYLEQVNENPAVTQFAPARIYNMIMKAGTEPVDDKWKTRGYEDLVRYKFFDGKIFGMLEPIHDLMRFLKAAARRTETGRRILLLMGPVSSGKSTVSALIKKGIENDDTPLYAIEGCPLHEEPLHAIPENDRPAWEEKLGIKISGFLCPHCQKVVDDEYTDKETGIINWHELKVKQISLSEQRRLGIGTFYPSDPKSQDITELIGRINMTKVAKYGETDPRGYSFDGEIQIANRGVIEYIEILKADPKFLHVLISVAQEQVVKSPGFPQMHIDTLILSHTNQTEFDKYKSNKENEAIHDRMYLVKWPWNVTVDDEIKIYEKLIAESEFKDAHVAPWAMKVAASFAVLSRLTRDTKVTSMVEKMKYYNDEVTEKFKKQDVDVKALKEAGRENGEGMSGISPRFVVNAMFVALGMKEEKGIVKDGSGKEYKGCINPIDFIRNLKANFDHHVGQKEEEIKAFMNLLTGDKESVAAEYKEVALKEVNKAFLWAYEDQAQTLFERYDEHVAAYVRKRKVVDSITGEQSPPDETIMRSIEDLVGIPENGKDEFRQGISTHKLDALETGREWNYATYPVLKEAIQKKLASDLKNVVDLSIATPTNTNPKAKRKRDKALENLLNKGYCESCAATLLAFVGEILRKK